MGDFDAEEFIRDWPPAQPLPALVQDWCRYVPTATFDDPHLDAGRALPSLDTLQWPAATRPHAYKNERRCVAPSMDLSASFHARAPTSEWLPVVAEAPIASEG